MTCEVRWANADLDLDPAVEQKEEILLEGEGARCHYSSDWYSVVVSCALTS